MSKYRLPQTATPTTYELYLYPDLSTGLFKGSVVTTTRILKHTPEIVMHSHLLNVTSVTINNQTAKFQTDPKYERLIITKEDGANFTRAEVINIGIDYDGDMKDRIVGLYRSSYTNNKNVTRYMATSKFEPTYARQAFPCFDEPNMKATYKVHILKPDHSDYIALSNNPEVASEKVDGGVLVHFQETVPMSTYLSCFIVSDFEHTSNTFENNGTKIPFKVYASPGQLEKTTYAGEIGKKVIEFYINYFNIPYPLPKLDMVAIPDFVSGAMEHWGLVTYRETALLYTNETHSSANKQRVATVVAHELAHSWFGNLVTMNWWNDLWLNEGFATYIEYKGVQAVEDTWGMMDQFLISELHSVLALDATQGSHPIITTVSTPDQITEVFDTISYNKGASVLRMLESAVGEDNFRKGVTNYLNKYNYSNAITQDLWNEIQYVVGPNLNVSDFMDTFTVQMGFPILDVAVNGNKYVLTQRRFLIDPESEGTGPTSPLNYKWTIPVTYVTDLNKSEVIWFNKDATAIEVERPGAVKYLKFNSAQVGYYRVNYPESEWRNLISFYRNMSISDRTHLLEESFSIAESGDLTYKVPLDLTKSLEGEIDYVPWSVAYSALTQIATYLHNTQYETDFREYVVKILSPAYAQFTWEEDINDEHLQRLARVVVLRLACVMKHPDALMNAELKFKEWISADDNSSLSQDLRGIIYQYGMVNADEDTWKQMFNKFELETDANEKLKLMNGLSSTQNPTLLSRLIDLAKDETYIRGQDYFTLLNYIADNPIGRPIVWDYVRENWPALVERFTLNNRYLGRLIPGITNKFSTVTKLEEMNQFFVKYPEAGAGASARTQALETVKNNIKWLAKHKTVVEEWIVAATKKE